MKSKFELRSFKPELRAASEGEPTKLVGHAAIFNSPTDICGLFNEVIAPGAFAETIKADDVVALVNHDQNLVLGRNTAGTLTLSEDAKGLYFELTIPETTVAQDLVVLIQRGDVSSCSFAFSSIAESWDSKTNTRTLQTVKLYDVSIVTTPAYGDTNVSARSAQEVHNELLASAVPSKPDDAEATGIDFTPLNQYLEVLKSW